MKRSMFLKKNRLSVSFEMITHDIYQSLLSPFQFHVRVYCVRSFLVISANKFRNVEREQWRIKIFIYVTLQAMGMLYLDICYHLVS